MSTSTRTKYIYLTIIVAFFLVITIKGIVKNMDNGGQTNSNEPAPTISKPRQTESQRPKDLGPFVKKYAGTYYIKVVGDNSGVDEMLVLNSNGDCTWSYRGQSKYGSWTAEDGLIKTVIKGNSGAIPEDFALVRNRFVSTDSNIRYLKKVG
jgi:hypothetical protein